MKKIWLISYSFDGVMAGPSIRFQRYAPLFAERGYRLQFVTYRLSKDLPTFEAREHFDVHRVAVRIRQFSRTRFISQALLLILRRGGPGSNVMSFGFQTYQLWLIPWLKAIFRFKLFYINTMAASVRFWPGEDALAWLWNQLHLSLYRRLYRILDGVVCSTEALALEMKPLGLREDKTYIINNGVDTSRFRPLPLEEKISLRNRLGLPHDTLLFLFVGLKSERKGMRELCESWEEVINEEGSARLLLVGDEKEEASSEEFNNWWRDYKEKYLPSSIYIYPGSKNIAQWFQVADVFVFPSKKEGMPNVLLEAMACGLPVCMSRFIGYSSLDYGNPGETHLLFNHQTNNKELSSCLVSMIAKEELRKDLSRNARKHSQIHFDLAVSITKYLKLFTQ